MLADIEIWRDSLYLGGWCPAKTSTEVVEPATGAVLGTIGSASAEDVGQAVALARSAQPGWAARPAEERARVLRSAGELLADWSDEVADWLIREAGSPREKASFEIRLATGEFFAAAALAVQPCGEVLAQQDPRQQGVAVRIPCGVAGVIAPFNAPLQLAARSVAPALALGNAVVLKPDPRTAVSGGVLLARALELAGLPEGVFAVLPGDGSIGAALVADKGVDVVSFTGSTRAGLAVSAAAARNLTRAHLELGGNSALLVFPDVDLDWRRGWGPPDRSSTRGRSAWRPGGISCTRTSPRSTSPSSPRSPGRFASGIRAWTRRSRSGRSSTRGSGTGCIRW
ncbi:aldehyde dehydrogenase [Streptomyces sp. AA4]|nr:aldehyde dehydrogenase [Streptomyces sp. AA4]